MLQCLRLEGAHCWRRVWRPNVKGASATSAAPAPAAAIPLRAIAVPEMPRVPSWCLHFYIDNDSQTHRSLVANGLQHGLQVRRIFIVESIIAPGAAAQSTSSPDQ